MKQKQTQFLDGDKYAGEWVAFRPDSYEVVGHSRRLRDALEQAEQKGVDDPEIYQVPKTDAYFVG